MKKLLTLLLLLITLIAKSQELPTKPANGFAFPIGSKFTIKLSKIDSINYNYSVIAFEQFDKVVGIYNNDNLFEPNGQDSTIQFYFCLGTNDDTEEEKKKNRKILLLMKNYSKISFKYLSEIQRKENGEFETTSNVGIFANAQGTEMWPYMIMTIALNTFQNMKD